MPNGWETARHSVKQNYVDRHVKTAGQNYKEYLKSATYETLPVEKWEAAELKKGGFQEIWFSGVQGVEKNKINESATNRGLDFPEEDEEEGGKYRIIPGDHIAYRYEIRKFIAAGVYGQVVKAYDHAANVEVALKIMNNHTSIATRMGLEYHAVRFIQRHVTDDDQPFVVGAMDVFSFRNHQIFVYELLGDSLYDKYHRKKVRGYELKRIAWDILEGLDILHRIQLIHNDMKPDNILFTNDQYPYVKVIDYGLGCFRDYWDSKIPEERQGMKCPRYYVQTRYYRSPEVMLGHNYTTQSDMWSFGCIVGELYRGLELIYGESEIDQLAAIMETIGLPPRRLVQKSWRRDVYFKAVNYKTKGGFQRFPYRKDLKTVLKSEDELFIDFMNQTLEWDPELRLTPKQAMAHPWLRSFAEKRFSRLQQAAKQVHNL